MLLDREEGATQVTGGRSTSLRYPRAYVKYILAHVRWIASALILVDHSFAGTGGLQGLYWPEEGCTGRGHLKSLVPAWPRTPDEAARPLSARESQMAIGEKHYGRRSLLCLTKGKRSHRLGGRSYTSQDAGSYGALTRISHKFSLTH